MNENENQVESPNVQTAAQTLPPQPLPQTPNSVVPPAIEPDQDTVSETTVQPYAIQTPGAHESQTSETELHRSSFKRRIGRLGYLLGHVYLALAGVALLIVLFILMPALSLFEDGPFRLVMTLPLFIIGMAVVAVSILSQLSLLVRRLHDLGHEWYWMLLLIVPVVGFVFSLYLLLMPGKQGPNEWGEPDTSLEFLTVIGLK